MAPSRGPLFLWVLLLLLGTVAVAAAATIAAAPQLATGAELPQLEGTTLNGEAAVLPRDAMGRPVVVVFGFTKAASKITRAWLDGCRHASAPKPAAPPSTPSPSPASPSASAQETGLACYDVRMVEEVPRFFRGMMERGMRGDLPVELQRRTLLVYSQNDLWHARLA